MRALVRLAALGAAVILAAAGCSGSHDTGREPTATERAILDRLVAPTAHDVAPEQTEAAREEFVGACMEKEGLDYLGSPAAPSIREWLGRTEKEFRAEYGFGHSTTIDLAKAHEDFAIAELEKHQASFETLPAAERTRYRTRERECLQQSYAEFGFPENGTTYLPSDSPINKYTEQAYQATANDPRLTEATNDWSKCMRERGYDFTDRDRMGLPLQQAAEPFVTAYSTRARPLLDAGRTWKDLRVADVLTSAQLAELRDLQQRELTVSAAHQHCIDQGHDIDAAYSKIYAEHLAQIARS